MKAPTVVRISVEKDQRDPNLDVPHEERVGNCAEYAFHYQKENGGLLVHGSIWHPQYSTQRIGHAWVECEDGGTFDPTLGLWFPMRELFATWANTIIDARYDQEAATINVLRHGHYGIWHEDPSGHWGEREE